MIRAAKAYVQRLDFDLVVADSEKVPLKRYFPNGASSATKRLALLERALRTPGSTLAARVGAHLVLDVDIRHGGDAELAKLLARFGPLPPTWTAETPTGGVHVWFKPLEFKPRGSITRGVELLTGNRLVTLSPSERAGGRYRWTQHPLKTPLATAPQWLINAAEPPPAPKRPERTSDDDPETREKRARAYIAKLDPAISGNHGHAATMRAAVIVVRGFDLEPEVALSVLAEWNIHNDPPWSERELRRKVNEAGRRGSLEWGAMLTERDAA